ncbi:MAG: ribosome biogenesis GTPase YlqF [Clostridia bacterium]|nr:ribosome biogenesis GTPase YlqF [Oscillospiraceae bacterium]MBQ7032536.1 ribosome biogenesis GTPase YlqF [Clostridia bacterium]
MQIQWFPGHMAKTARLITENLKLTDVVIEIADARIPVSSRNPYLAKLLAGKPRVLVLNKADLADPAVNALWKKQYEKNNEQAVFINSRDDKIWKTVISGVEEALKELLQRRAEKNMQGKPVRMMITGIPNVGKSTFINNLSGKASAKTGDRPGVTTGKQWVTLRNGYELLDTPGMLWQKFEGENEGLHLAFTGAIRDEVVDPEELAVALLNFLRNFYPIALTERYRIENPADMDGYELLCSVAKARNFVVRGGEPDTVRAAQILIDECRGAKLGRISFERPEE